MIIIKIDGLISFFFLIWNVQHWLDRLWGLLQGKINIYRRYYAYRIGIMVNLFILSGISQNASHCRLLLHVVSVQPVDHRSLASKLDQVAQNFI